MIAIAELLEDLTFSLGEGVCVRASATGRPVLVPDLSEIAQTSRVVDRRRRRREHAGVGTADAFARLRACAFAEQRLLGDVAHDVVTDGCSSLLAANAAGILLSAAEWKIDSLLRE